MFITAKNICCELKRFKSFAPASEGLNPPSEKTASQLADCRRLSQTPVAENLCPGSTPALGTKASWKQGAFVVKAVILLLALNLLTILE